MKEYPSIIDENIRQFFSIPKDFTLFAFALNICRIDDALLTSSYFCPAIVEIDDCIFIKQFYNDETEQRYRYLFEQFNGDKKKIERWNNAWSLPEFFLNSWTESVENEELIEQFGRALKYFWELRFKDLFPTRRIIVELGMEIEGENGLTITVYQEHD